MLTVNWPIAGSGSSIWVKNTELISQLKSTAPVATKPKPHQPTANDLPRKARRCEATMACTSTSTSAVRPIGPPLSTSTKKPIIKAAPSGIRSGR